MLKPLKCCAAAPIALGARAAPAPACLRTALRNYACPCQHHTFEQRDEASGDVRVRSTGESAKMKPVPAPFKLKLLHRA